MNYSKPYPTLSPMLSELHRINPVKWAKKYKYPAKEWSKTIFVNEMSIWLARGRLRSGLRKTKNEYVQPRNFHSK